MRKIIGLVGLCIAGIGVVFALDSPSTTHPKSLCEKEICFMTPTGKVQYEQKFNCQFKDCHLANGEDIFRWAIGKKETGNFGYDMPDSNPCNAANKYCAATTGNPASAGREKHYAASYGPQQITLPLLFDWLNPKGKTKFSPVPECLQKWFLDDKSLMDAIKEANKRLAFGKGLVSGRKVPAATVGKDGKIFYSNIPKGIQHQAEKLNIGKGENAEEWSEMWERMAAWERLRQIIEAKWKEMGGNKIKAWKELSLLSNNPDKKNGQKNPTTQNERDYLALLERLEMKNSGLKYVGVAPYITSKIWNEAAVGFGNFALFAGAPSNLYTRLMAFFANKDCHIASVKQMFQLPKHGYDGTHVDPQDAQTEKWVKKAAGAWNGASSKSAYSKLAFDYYKSYYEKHYGKTEVCN